MHHDLSYTDFKLMYAYLTPAVPDFFFKFGQLDSEVQEIILVCILSEPYLDSGRWGLTPTYCMCVQSRILVFY